MKVINVKFLALYALIMIMIIIGLTILGHFLVPGVERLLPDDSNTIYQGYRAARQAAYRANNIVDAFKAISTIAALIYVFFWLKEIVPVTVQKKSEESKPE